MSAARLDDTDRTIIELLQADGRMAFTKVAAEVGLTEGAIRQRVQRLTDAGVMQIVAVTDPLHLVATAGRYDLMFEVVADDDAHLLALLSRLRERDDILEAEAFVCLKLFKQTFSWGAR